MSNGIWILTDRPPNRNVIGSRWVFKVKPEYAGVSKKCKARLVAQGYTQCHGVDFNETFSPVLKYGFLRKILSISVFHNLEISLVDVKTAFLNGDLNDFLYGATRRLYLQRR